MNIPPEVPEPSRVLTAERRGQIRQPVHRRVQPVEEVTVNLLLHVTAQFCVVTRSWLIGYGYHLFRYDSEGDNP